MTNVPNINIDIDVARQSESWPDIDALTQTVIETTATHTLDANTAYELSILLSDDHNIQELNKTYRGKDKPTNVLSFPQDIEGFETDLQMLGDIILSLDTLKREAEEQEKSFNDHYAHLLVHGFLHLIGHDHDQDEEAEIMEKLEIDILRQLNIKNPYAT